MDDEFVLLLLGGHVITVLVNSDPIAYGAVHAPPHVPYDAVHTLVDSTFDYLLPFILGIAMFRGTRDLASCFALSLGRGWCIPSFNSSRSD